MASAGWEAVDFLQSPGVGRATLGGGEKKKTSVNFIGIIFRKGQRLGVREKIFFRCSILENT